TSDGIGMPKLIVQNPFREVYKIEIIWEGEHLEQPKVKKIYSIGEAINLQTLRSKIVGVYDPQSALSETLKTATQWKGNVKGSEDKTFFVKLQQGNMIWWSPINIIIKPKIEGNPIRLNGDTLIFALKNNSQNNIKGDLIFRPYGTAILQNIALPKNGDTTIAIPVQNLVPGTNAIEFRTDNGETHKISFTNWDIPIRKEQQSEVVPLSEIFNAKVTDIFNYNYLSPRPQTPTLQLPTQGIGNWCYPNIAVTIDDSGLREKAKTNQQVITPQGISLQTPSDSNQKNIAFTSLWDNFPESISIPLQGNASHLYVMVSGTTNPMQSRFVNGELVVRYTDGSSEVLLLKNPENWWPIEQDYFSDGFAFSTDAPKPPRVYLKSGIITRSFDDFKPIKGYSNFGIDGGAATILDLPLDKSKKLQTLTIKTIANDVVIGLMSATLIR
ncbi:MAG TPA: glycogen debranching protein, partial [Flavobacterium sp.]